MTAIDDRGRITRTMANRAYVYLERNASGLCTRARAGANEFSLSLIVVVVVGEMATARYQEKRERLHACDPASRFSRISATKDERASAMVIIQNRTRC